MSPIYRLFLVLTSFAPLAGVIAMNHIGFKPGGWLFPFLS